MAKVMTRLLVVSSLMLMHTSSPIRDADTATETLTDAMVCLIINSIFDNFSSFLVWLDISKDYLSFDQYDQLSISKIISVIPYLSMNAENVYYKLST